MKCRPFAEPPHPSQAANFFETFVIVPHGENELKTEGDKLKLHVSDQHIDGTCDGHFPPPNGRRLSSELLRLKDVCNQNKISLYDLIENMSARSHAFLTLVFAIPFLFPIPIPGLSVLFGVVIIFAGVAMGIGKKPWLPKKLLNREVSTHLFQKIFEYGVKGSQRLEKFVKPRGSFVLRHPWMRAMNGFMIAFCGLLLALPLPPGTNFPPAIAVLLLSIGSLEEDAVFMIFGYGAFVINLVFFGVILIFGANGIRMLMPA